MLPPKISLHQICKSFGSRLVLDHLDLDIYQGESLVILGGSGTGKSVLLKCILGLLKADKGSMIVNGQEAFSLRGRAYETYLRQFSMMFQGSALFDSLTIWENVTFGLRQLKKISKKEARDIAIETLAQVGLTPEIADYLPSELSGGMQRRVALARAIVTQPEIVFFDEPTAGLDPIISAVINDLIVRCSEQLGATAVTITHDITSARKIADRVAMIHNGKIIWVGSIDTLDNSGNPFVDQFIHGRIEGPIQLQVDR